MSAPITIWQLSIRRLREQILPDAYSGMRHFWIGLFSMLSFGLASAHDACASLSAADGIVDGHLMCASGLMLEANPFPFQVSVGANGQRLVDWQLYYPQWKSTGIDNICCNGTEVTGWMLSTNDIKVTAMNVLLSKSGTFLKVGRLFPTILFISLIGLPAYVFVKSKLGKDYD